MNYETIRKGIEFRIDIGMNNQFQVFYWEKYQGVIYIPFKSKNWCHDGKQILDNIVFNDRMDAAVDLVICNKRKNS
jgi:hypothetical protein